MEYSIIPRAELAVNRWSGGTTTQLAIGPAGASYAARDFTWRVSSATIEDEESDFTPLSGYTRILMVLDGGISLIHEHGQPVPLGRFEQARFPGSVPTRSCGCATDFNLMMREGLEGSVEALHIPPGEKTTVAVPASEWARHSEVYYVLRGKVSATLPGGTALTADEGSVLTVHCGNGDAGAEISLAAIPAESEAVVIRAGVLYNG